MTSPKVSVVIPAHNAEPWIRETLASVTRDSYPNREIVLVDDGSSDDTSGVASSLGISDLRIVRTTRGGPSRARNVGTAAATGDVFLYMDADDLLGDLPLSARVRALVSADADVAYSDWMRWVRSADPGGFEAGETVRRRLGPRPEIDIFTTAWWPPGSLLYARRVVERIGLWREDLSIVQDARFLLDAALCGGRFVHAPGVGCLYRQTGPESVSRSSRTGFVRDVYSNACSVHAVWRRRGGIDAERKEALLSVYGYVARESYERDPPLFKRAVRRLYALEPGYRPRRPWTLRWVSGLVGYVRAEAVALCWRRLSGRGRPPGS